MCFGLRALLHLYRQLSDNTLKTDPEFLRCATKSCPSVQDMAKVSYHFVRGKNPKKFASTLVNFMGKVF